MAVLPIDRAVSRPRFTRINRRALFLPLLLLAALVSLLYLGQTSDIAATGYAIADLQNQQQTLEMRHEQLEFKIAQLKSLDRVDQEATTRLHMGPPQRVVYVTAPSAPATIPTPTPAPAPTHSMSPIGAFFQWISGGAALSGGGS